MILSICTQLTARQHACTSNCPFKLPSMLSVDQAETNGDLLSKLTLVISIVYGRLGSSWLMNTMSLIVCMQFSHVMMLGS